MNDTDKTENKQDENIKNSNTPPVTPEDGSTKATNSSPYESPGQHKDSIASWFSIGALGTSLTGKNSKDGGKVSESESGSSWSSTWLQSAKEKTFDTFESMKKDINEFTDTIQHEACSIATVAASSVKNQAQFIQQQISQQLSTGSDGKEEDNSTANVDDNNTKLDKKTAEDSPSSAPATSKASASRNGETTFFAPSKWMRSFVESVQKLGMEDTIRDEAEFTEEIRFPETPLTRKTNLDQYQLVQIQNDENTYLQKPVKNVDLYREWLAEFRIMEYNGEINILLGYNPKLREVYSKLVPSEVDNFTFWNRYFFKVYLQELDKEIAQRSAMSKVSDGDSNNGSGERDETWSLCSSANNDIQDLDDEVTTFDTTADENDDNPIGHNREELKTPQLETSESDGKEEPSNVDVKQPTQNSRKTRSTKK